MAEAGLTKDAGKNDRPVTPCMTGRRLKSRESSLCPVCLRPLFREERALFFEEKANKTSTGSYKINVIYTERNISPQIYARNLKYIYKNDKNARGCERRNRRHI